MINTQLKNLDNIDISQFQVDLISWFESEMRDLPWRKDKDPYKVWVSEIMLQQTRVDTVIPYFNRFIEQFPTIDKLAEAEEEKVLKAWEGLGYYSRARNLQAAVKEVKASYGSIVPSTPEEIVKLKGVGPYTAGAILSIAYGIPEPAVDGNVMRVISRILSIWEDIAKPSTRKIFEEAIRKMIAHSNPSYFNQAVMELGALICTPTSPSCLLCPVREHCSAFHEGVQSELPVKTKKKSTKTIPIAAAVLIDDKGRYLIHKRPSKGLLANLWEFPNVELKVPYSTADEQIADYTFNQFGLKSKIEGTVTGIDHVFSHLVWNIEVMYGTIYDGVLIDERSKWVTSEELNDYAFPVSHQKIWKHYKESR